MLGTRAVCRTRLLQRLSARSALASPAAALPRCRSRCSVKVRTRQLSTAGRQACSSTSRGSLGVLDNEVVINYSQLAACWGRLGCSAAVPLGAHVLAFFLLLFRAKADDGACEVSWACVQRGCSRHRGGGIPAACSSRAASLPF